MQSGYLIKLHRLDLKNQMHFFLIRHSQEFSLVVPRESYCYFDAVSTSFLEGEWIQDIHLSMLSCLAADASAALKALKVFYRNYWLHLTFAIHSL